MTWGHRSNLETEVVIINALGIYNSSLPSSYPQLMETGVRVHGDGHLWSVSLLMLRRGCWRFPLPFPSSASHDICVSSVHSVPLFTRRPPRFTMFLSVPSLGGKRCSLSPAGARGCSLLQCEQIRRMCQLPTDTDRSAALSGGREN